MWYYNKSGSQKGPYDESLIADAITAGRLPADALVWKEGMPEWLPLHQSELAHFLQQPPVTPSPPSPPPAYPPPPFAPSSPRLWNPNAAGILSVLLFPPFGAFIHGLNWKALGRKDEARTSFLWAGGIFFVVLVNILLSTRSLGINGFLLAAILLIVWHYAHGKKQVSFTKALPGGYEKKSLWPPALIAIGAAIVMWLFFVAITMMSDSLFGAVSETVDVERESFEHSTEYESASNEDDSSHDTAENSTLSTMQKDDSRPGIEKKSTLSITRKDGSPSDQLVSWVASTMNWEDENRSFKRGEVLVSRGGSEIARGTLIYPIKFEHFPYPFYLSQDEFGDWRFSIGDLPSLIPVKPPETPEEKRAREQKQLNERNKTAELMQGLLVEEARRREEYQKKNIERKGFETTGRKSGNQTPINLVEAKSELAALDSKIESERKRWTEAMDTINRLTNFKKTPVKEGSPAYHQCMAASRVIQEVEQKAPEMKAEKARLEALIKEMSPSE